MAADRVTLRIHKDGQVIESLEDWFDLAPPQGGLRQWKDGRSAKETARRWLGGIPTEITNALESHPDFAGFAAHTAEPELETRLDEFPRTRNHDLVVEGSCGQRKAVLCIEAKADESFDEVIGKRLEEATELSDLPERIRRISMALFGHDRMDEIADLRYQLLQASAGSLIEAQGRNADICVLLVHVFRTHLTDDRRIANNAADLDRFVSLLTNTRFETVPPNTIVGPITVPGYMSVPGFKRFYIAKAIADLSAVHRSS